MNRAGGTVAGVHAPCGDGCTSGCNTRRPRIAGEKTNSRRGINNILVFATTSSAPTFLRIDAHD